MKIDLAQTIIKLNPTAKVSITNDVYETIVWNDTPVIAKNIIIAKQAELQAEYDSKEYQRQRANEYPDLKEYLDGIVKGDNAQIQKYINDCLAVKAKYPKE
jgi:hypothetical protein